MVYASFISSLAENRNCDRFYASAEVTERWAKEQVASLPLRLEVDIPFWYDDVFLSSLGDRSNRPRDNDGVSEYRGSNYRCSEARDEHRKALRKTSGGWHGNSTDGRR